MASARKLSKWRIFYCLQETLRGSLNSEYKYFEFVYRKLVLIATQDAFETHMNNEAYTCLQNLGAVKPIRAFRASFALLGYSGPGQLDAVSQVRN